MTEERRQLRPKTAHEKEVENAPDCLYDPLDDAFCRQHAYPPPRRSCEICLVGMIIDAMADRANSEAMRWFIAYRFWALKKRNAGRSSGSA